MKSNFLAKLKNKIKFFQFLTTLSLFGLFVVPAAYAFTASGFVFYDQNQNGVKDAGEPGLPGVNVTGQAGANCFTFCGNSVTDNTGFYSISGFPTAPFPDDDIMPSSSVLTVGGRTYFNENVFLHGSALGVNFGTPPDFTHDFAYYIPVVPTATPSPTPTISPTPSLTPTDSPTPSGTIGSTCPLTLPTTTGNAVLSTQLTISTASAYTVWSRVMDPNPGTGSYYLALGSQCPILTGTDQAFTQWLWTNADLSDPNMLMPVTYNLTPGSYTLTLYGNTPDLKVDRLIVEDASDPNACIPTGTGDNCNTSAVTDTPVPTATVTPGDTPQPTLSPTPVQSSDVNIVDFAFQPVNVVINVGDTVTWHNIGTVNHTSTSDISSTEVWDSGQIAPGTTFSHTFNTAGIFNYHCSNHLFMHGTVTVLPLNATVTSTPSVTPTVTPTDSPTPSPTLTVTPTLTITPTPQPNDTILALEIGLTGIGNTGDNTNPSAFSLSNHTPLTTSRQITVELTNPSQQLFTQTGFVNYASSSGTFNGTIDFQSTLPTGNYQIKVKTNSFLKGSIQFIQPIQANTTTTLSRLNLIAGDVNNDNELSIADYSIILLCMNNDPSCTSAQMQASDLDDNGVVDISDLTLFLRNLAVQFGQ